MKSKYSLLLLLVLPASWGAIASAAQLEVHPRITLEEEYNDNIYLVPENKTDDYITTVSPGITLGYLTRLLNIDLDYGFYFRKYRDNSKEDETSLRDTQRGKGTLDFFPGRPFTLTVFDEYSKVYIDPRLQTVAENNFVNRTTRNQLVINPQYHYRGSPTFEAIVGYRMEKLDYQASAGDDSIGHTGTLELRKSLAPHFNVSLIYGIEQRNNRWSDDYLRQFATLGFSRQFGARLIVDARAGAGRVDFNNLNQYDSTIFIGDFNTSYALTQRLSAILHYGEDFSIATIDGLFKHRIAEVRLSYGATGGDFWLNRGSADLALHWTRDNYVQIDRTDRTLGGTLAARLPLGKLLALVASGSYDHLNFSDPAEKVDRFGVGGGFELMLPPALFKLSYLYRDSNSDIDSNDYQNNIYLLSAMLRF